VGELTENVLVAAFTVLLSGPGSAVSVKISVQIKPAGPVALKLMLGYAAISAYM